MLDTIWTLVYACSLFILRDVFLSVLAYQLHVILHHLGSNPFVFNFPKTLYIFFHHMSLIVRALFIHCPLTMISYPCSLSSASSSIIHTSKKVVLATLKSQQAFISANATFFKSTSFHSSTLSLSKALEEVLPALTPPTSPF